MADGAFSDAARKAIYEAGNGRCIGCGRTDLSAQHRRARGMGGTSLADVAQAANGVPLCGDGTRGCHGWTESHPTFAGMLGWRLEPGDPVEAPFWTRFGWRRWEVDVDGFPSVAYVDEVEDLTDVDRRRHGVDAFLHWLAIRNGKAKR